MSDGDKREVGGHDLDEATVKLVLREAKDLIRSLEGTAIHRINVRAGSLQIEVERSAGGTFTGQALPAPPTAAPAAGTMPIVAPIVGVFYRASAPGAKPFVEVGDAVERGQTVAIVEAMKVMNEVLSDYRGRVVEILVENGDAVEFEQPLMRIDTSGRAVEGEES